MGAEDNVYALMWGILIVGVGAILFCGLFALFLYGGNDLTTYWYLVLLSIALSIFVLMILSELALGLLYALFGIRKNLKVLHEDVLYFSDLYTKNSLIMIEKERIEKREAD